MKDNNNFDKNLNGMSPFEKPLHLNLITIIDEKSKLKFGPLLYNSRLKGYGYKSINIFKPISRMFEGKLSQHEIL